MNSRAMARSKAGRSETRAQTRPTSIATAARATCPTASPTAPNREMVAIPDNKADEGGREIDQRGGLVALPAPQQSIGDRGRSEHRRLHGEDPQHLSRARGPKPVLDRRRKRDQCDRQAHPGSEAQRQGGPGAPVSEFGNSHDRIANADHAH